MRPRAIEMRFLRSANRETFTERDDILKITKLGENNVRVCYTERSLGGAVMDLQNMTYQTCLAYLIRVFHLLTIDEDPFQSVQISFPNHPTILLSVSSLKTNMGSILELFTSLCVAWPRAASLVGSPQEPSNNSSGANSD